MQYDLPLLRVFRNLLPVNEGFFREAAMKRLCADFILIKCTLVWSLLVFGLAVWLGDARFWGDAYGLFPQ